MNVTSQSFTTGAYGLSCSCLTVLPEINECPISFHFIHCIAAIEIDYDSSQVGGLADAAGLPAEGVSLQEGARQHGHVVHLRVAHHRDVRQLRAQGVVGVAAT